MAGLRDGPRFRTTRPVGWALTAAALLMLAGCGRGGPANAADNDGWRGYVFGDVMANVPPRVTGGFTSGAACLAGMRTAMRGAAPLAGWACGRDCSVTGRFVADCQDIRP